jgi:hypothetical protein
MLIVAMPKSASTALMVTLGKLHNLPAKQVDFPDMPKCQEVKILWKYHYDIVEIDQNIAHQFADQEVIYKQHIIPTDNNLELLQSQKIVVLLRSIEGVIFAYQRALLKNMMALPELNSTNDNAKWLKQTKQIGLYHDIWYFYQKWLSQTQENKLFIFYKDLLQDPTKTINDIGCFWELPTIKKNIILEKERYTRYSNFEQFIGKLSRFFGIYDLTKKVNLQMLKWKKYFTK